MPAPLNNVGYKYQPTLFFYITRLTVSYQALLWLDEWPVDAVHLVVEAAGVAQVVSGAVPAPQRRGHGAAVDALPALGGHVVHRV